MESVPDRENEGEYDLADLPSIRAVAAQAVGGLTTVLAPEPSEAAE